MTTHRRLLVERGGWMKRFLPYVVVVALAAMGALSLPTCLESPTAVPTYTYRVVNTYPHDPEAFTQGLEYEGGFLFESTGQYGHSSLRKVVLETGKVVQQHDLADTFFGEGITLLGDAIIQLTWRQSTGFVYDKASFEVQRTFLYATEGWGLTHDDTHLIMSDGTATLQFLDPSTFEVTGQLLVQEKGAPVTRLNELEYVQGQIFANVWQSNRIVRINPESGQVTGWIDLKGLLPAGTSADVLNGIAYDAAADRLFVTGKLWPNVFEIELVEVQETIPK